MALRERSRKENRYVFISYSYEDTLFAQRLSEALIKRGLRVWMAANEIRPGQNWRVAIQEGLHAATILLLVASRHSARSHWVGFEAEAFLSSGKRIITVVLDEEGKEMLAGSLAAVHWVDFHGRQFNSGVDQILSSMADIMPPVKRARPPRQKSKGYFFISYAEEDTDFMTELREFLKGRGYAYWDYAESARNYNAQTVFELEDAIANSAACLCVISEAWRSSRWTIREYFFAEEVKRPGFLLKAKPIRPSLAIAGSTYIDFTVDAKQGFARLDAALSRKRL